MDFDQTGIGDPLMVEAVCLHFQVEVFFSKNFLKFPSDRHGAGHVFLPDQIRNLSAETAGQRNQTLRMLS